MSVSLGDVLKAAIERRATCLHLAVAAVPRVRVGHELVALPFPPLAEGEARSILRTVMGERHQRCLDEERPSDFAFDVEGLGRFRAHAFVHHGGIGAVIRVLPSEVRTLEELGLPRALARIADLSRGLVLVTGPASSGRSATLAAFVDRIARARAVHISTIEEPVEFVHAHQCALVTQHEIGLDAASPAAAIRSTLREDADVVAVDVSADGEAMEGALLVVESGRLALVTMNAPSATQAIDRVIDLFPVHRQAAVRDRLSNHLEGIIYQQLLPAADGHGFVPAVEVLTPTPAIRNLVREDKIEQIDAMMQTGQAKFGMQTLDQALATLWMNGRITADVALRESRRPDELRALIERRRASVKGESSPPALDV